MIDQTTMDVDVRKGNDHFLDVCNDQSLRSAPTAQSEDTQMNPYCQEGHELEPYVTDDDLVMCDRCLFRGSRGDKLFACRECNYDLCIRCAATDASPRLLKATKPEIKLIPRSEENPLTPLSQGSSPLFGTDRRDVDLDEPYFNLFGRGFFRSDAEDKEAKTSRMEGNGERDYEDSLWKHVAGLPNSPLQRRAESPEESSPASDVIEDLDASQRMLPFYAI
jgi:hypothetical protein